MTHEIRLSTSLTTFAAEDPGGWEPMLARAEMLDRVGVDRLVVSDHVVFGEDLEAYSRPERGGTAGGKQPTGPDGHWLEPLTTLAVIVGRTRRIRVGTNILIAALRRPVVLAKTCATLDVLSQGRFDLGIGVGWQREEYLAAGLSYETRGRLLDETLALCRTLWTEQRATLEIDGAVVEGIHMMPKPVQAGGVPVWVSGTLNPKVVQRLVRFGSGWIPWGADAADPAAIARMRRAVTDAGGDGDALEVVWRLPAVLDDEGGLDVAATVAQVPALVDAGATDLRIGVPAGVDEDGWAALVGEFRRVLGRRST